jgi:hypothetical protein
MEALTGEKAKGPRRGFSVKLQKAWPSVKEDVCEMEYLKKLNGKLQVGSPLYEITKEALSWAREPCS